MPRILDFSDGFTSTSAPSASTAVGSFYQEVPTGTINGSNAVFTLAHEPSDANSLIFLVDSNQLESSQFSLATQTVTITDSAFVPVVGQSVYAYYISGGGAGSGGDITGLTPRIENVTLTGTDISNKYITLVGTPFAPTKTVLDIIGVGPQIYGVDFTVTGATLGWTGLGLDGQIISGDKFRVLYFTEGGLMETIIKRGIDPAIIGAANGLATLDGSGKLSAAQIPSTLVSDTAYDATSWDSVTDVAPSKNAVRDEIETILSSVTGSVSDTAYDATSWNGVTTIAPSKNAVRDELEIIIASVTSAVSDTAYNATSWDSVTTIAPSKNAVRDQVETMLSSISGKQPLDTQLTDLAALSYTGNTLKVIRVNAGETAFELAASASPTYFQQVFNGDGSTVAFTLTHTPVTQISCLVLIDGMPQLSGTDFTTSGTTLTLSTTTPAIGQTVFVYYTY